jgi:hypothetical protein
MKTNLQSAVLCFFILVVLPAIKALPISTDLEGARVTMSLAPRTAVKDEVAWPNEPIVLSVRSVPVKGRTIQELLRSNHISPDVEAYGLVYRLNRDLTNLNDLPVSEIRLPTVQGGRELERMLSNGYIIIVTVDVNAKQSFTQSVERLSTLIQDPSRLAASRFAHGEKATASIQSVNLVSDRLNRIGERVTQRYGPVIPAEALRQLDGETRHLNDILSANKKIGSSEYAFIDKVRKDVELKSRPFVEAAAGEAPSRWPEVIVKVTTMKAGHEVPGLRILYVPEALRKYPAEFRSFGNLSSPSKESLPEADYCFWAIRDLDQRQRALSEVRCREVRTEQVSVVQLTVVQ